MSFNDVCPITERESANRAAGQKATTRQCVIVCRGDLTATTLSIPSITGVRCCLGWSWKDLQISEELWSWCCHIVRDGVKRGPVRAPWEAKGRWLLTFQVSSYLLLPLQRRVSFEPNEMIGLCLCWTPWSPRGGSSHEVPANTIHLPNAGSVINQHRFRKLLEYYRFDLAFPP